MVDRFVSYRTGPAVVPGEPGAVIRKGGDGAVELVNLAWGLAPPAPGARPLTYIRSEGRRFGSRRCLVPGSEFTVSKGQGSGRRKWRVTLAGADGNFYFAGMWRPAERGWGASYALITIAAGPDLALHQERQVAIIRRERRMAWLDYRETEADLIAPSPRGTFRLEQIEGPATDPFAAKGSAGWLLRRLGPAPALACARRRK